MFRRTPATKTFEKTEVTRVLRTLFSTDEEYEFMLSYLSIALTKPYYMGPKMTLSNTKATFLREFVRVSLGADMFIVEAESSGEETGCDPMYDILIRDTRCHQAFKSILWDHIESFQMSKL